jgi:hypothetical protein
MLKHPVISVDGYSQIVCQEYPQIVPLDPFRSSDTV